MRFVPCHADDIVGGFFVGSRRLVDAGRDDIEIESRRAQQVGAARRRRCKDEADGRIAHAYYY
jgi:hypothetical protein